MSAGIHRQGKVVVRFQRSVAVQSGFRARQLTPRLLERVRREAEGWQDSSHRHGSVLHFDGWGVGGRVPTCQGTVRYEPGPPGHFHISVWYYREALVALVFLAGALAGMLLSKALERGLPVFAIAAVVSSVILVTYIAWAWIKCRRLARAVTDGLGQSLNVVPGQCAEDERPLPSETVSVRPSVGPAPGNRVQARGGWRSSAPGTPRDR